MAMVLMGKSHRHLVLLQKLCSQSTVIKTDQDTEDTLPLPGHVIDVPWDSETEESGDVHRSLLPPRGGLDDVHASWAATESDDDLSEVPSGDMKCMGPMDSVLRFDSGRECGTPESFYQVSDHYTQPDD